MILLKRICFIRSALMVLFVTASLQAFTAIDIDRSGGISFSEYTNFVLKYKRSQMKGKEYACFYAIDSLGIMLCASDSNR